jgi:hypothetical protein
LDDEHAVSGKVVMNLDRKIPKDKDDDLWFLFFGDADWGSIFVTFMYVVAFGLLLGVGIFSYGFFSGGMRWLMVLFLTTCLAIVTVLLMKRGIESIGFEVTRSPPVDVFRGDLTNLTEITERASLGYAYSQQLIRERVAEALADKVRIVEGLTEEEMFKLLEKKEVPNVRNEELARFIVDNKRGADGWDDKVKKDGRSKEAGRIFIREINEILDKTEVMT